MQRSDKHHAQVAARTRLRSVVGLVTWRPGYMVVHTNKSASDKCNPIYLRRRWLLMDGPRSLEGKLEPIDDEQSLLHRDQLDHVKQSLEAFSGQVLPKLNRKLADVFRLRFTEGLSQTEAAQRLGVPRSTLGDREQRLLAHLNRFVCSYQRAR